MAHPHEAEVVAGVPATSSPDETDYLSRLGNELTRVVGSGQISTLTELLRAGKGATPDLILDLLKGPYQGGPLPRRILAGENAADFPELHPLLFEWYFTSGSSRFIAEVALGAGQEILCLGTPSVAAQFAASSVRPELALVDASPSVTTRFPNLLQSQVHIGELATFKPTSTYSVVVADPPWYLADTMRWLKAALDSVSPGGTVIMPLFPELTRPAASEERRAILSAAQRAGEAELWNSRVIYRTPGFEKHALRALGVPDTGDWRCGDLLVVRKAAASFAYSAPHETHRGMDGWRRFVIGSQVVMLRDIETTSQSPATFLPIAGCPRNTLTSVSERDPRRALIGLWTSRNRVAAVGNVRAAAQLLQFAAGEPVPPPSPASSAWMFLQDLLQGR